MDFESLIVVPSARYARTLETLWQKKCALQTQASLAAQDSGEAVFDAPTILSFDQWLLRLRDELLLRGELPARRLLSDFAEQILWQRIVQESAVGDALLSTKLGASSAKKAYKLLCQWNIRAVDHAFELKSRPDSEAFLTWASRFEQLCDESAYHCVGDMHCAVLKCLQARSDARSGFKQTTESMQVQAVGFVKPTPVQIALFECFSASWELPDRQSIERVLAGDSDRSLADETATSASVSQYLDFEQELLAAARWAKHVQAAHPDREVAIVVPDLAAQRAKVDRVFRSVFEPISLELGKVSNGQAFNLSAGESLASTTLVSAALGLLQAAIHGLPLAHWMQLLLSPYFYADAFSPADRRSLLKALNEGAEGDLKLAEIPALLRWYREFKGLSAEQGKGGEELFSAVVNEFDWLRSGRERTKVDTLPQWLSQFSSLLQRFYFAQSRSLNSEEYQQFQSFNAALQEFSKLDDILGRVTIHRALQLLKEFLASVVFHSETANLAQNIPSVYGVLEGAAVFVDHLWIVGVSAAQWPPSSTPNPLLGIDFQRRLDMPGASPLFEREYAAGLTHQLLGVSRHLCLSYPSQVDGIDTSLAASFELPLQRAGFDLSAATDNSLISTPSLDIASQAETTSSDDVFEYLDDQYGAAIATVDDQAKSESTDEIIEVRGGVGFLTQIANNPLRAYFQFRMNISPLQTIAAGFSRQERGIVIHRVLERIWQQLHTQQQLLTLSSAALAERVSGVVLAEVSGIANKRFKPIPLSVIRVEVRHIISCVQTWLELELSRPSFSVVGFEQRLSVALSGISLSGRLDRVDCLDDGSYLLLDYKTGVVNRNNLLSDPVSDPQLPFYVMALASNTDLMRPIKGVSFACLKPGAIGFSGVAAEDSVALEIAGITQAEGMLWDDCVEYWRDEVNRLFEQIAAGFAALQEQEDCSDDDYQPLLRSTFNVQAAN